jgi:aryl-phospho-beta-D-glucosidase BglC (GH1 family)
VTWIKNVEAWEVAGVARYGFNFTWMLPRDGATPRRADERALDFMAAHGLDFVRIPTSYRVWTDGFDYDDPDESIFELLDSYLEACQARRMHLSLNLHRAPGYCITGWELERDNLWVDEVAQDAFVAIWQRFAQRWRDVPAADLSFDLINEPPAIGLRGFTRSNHAQLIRRTLAAVRAVDAERPITVDGLDGGNLAMPELADLDVMHSGRGYAPYPISHWGAPWFDGWRDGDAPRWPGVRYAGRTWDASALRDVYAPWRAVEALGVEVHIGEMGCFNATPQPDALRWFADLLGLFHEYGWGFALWNFQGPFGIVDHSRPGAVFEDYYGYRVDRALLDLVLAARVDPTPASADR